MICSSFWPSSFHSIPTAGITEHRPVSPGSIARQPRLHPPAFRPPSPGGPGSIARRSRLHRPAVPAPSPGGPGSIAGRLRVHRPADPGFIDRRPGVHRPAVGASSAGEQEGPAGRLRSLSVGGNLNWQFEMCQHSFKFLMEVKSRLEPIICLLQLTSSSSSSFLLLVVLVVHLLLLLLVESLKNHKSPRGRVFLGVEAEAGGWGWEESILFSCSDYVWMYVRTEGGREGGREGGGRVRRWRLRCFPTVFSAAGSTTASPV